jgi:two-component system chemotaxis response regulator CheY
MTWVLVVDDDESIRESLRLILEDSGYGVLEATDGVMALNILRATPHSMIVLLDLMMPRLDGTGVLAAVADDPRLATHHAYILMTAGRRTLNLSLIRLLAELSIPVLPKPFELDAILELVAQGAHRLAPVTSN